jgi:hypothetical protein
MEMEMEMEMEMDRDEMNISRGSNAEENEINKCLQKKKRMADVCRITHGSPGIPSYNLRCPSSTPHEVHTTLFFFFRLYILSSTLHYVFVII